MPHPVESVTFSQHDSRYKANMITDKGFFLTMPIWSNLEQKQSKLQKFMSAITKGL